MGESGSWFSMDYMVWIEEVLLFFIVCIGAIAQTHQPKQEIPFVKDVKWETKFDEYQKFANDKKDFKKINNVSFSFFDKFSNKNAKVTCEFSGRTKELSQVNFDIEAPSPEYLNSLQQTIETVAGKPYETEEQEKSKFFYDLQNSFSKMETGTQNVDTCCN